jgi:hypothetical protein
MAAERVVVSQLYGVVRRAVRRLSYFAALAVFAMLARLSAVPGVVSFGMLATSRSVLVRMTTRRFLLAMWDVAR